MLKRLWMIAAVLLLSISAAAAETPDADALAAARNLVTTMKLTSRFEALVPIIIQGLKPALVQNRPEVERDFDAMVPTMLEAFRPYYNGMIDSVAVVYASNFTTQELRDIDAFYHQPAGQKLLEKTQTIMQQSLQIGQDFGQRAAQDLRNRIADELRNRGHTVPE